MRSLALLIVLALAGCATVDCNAACKSTDQSHYPQSKAFELAIRAPSGLERKFASVEQVDAFVNSLPYKSDQKNYGKSNYWATAPEMLQRGGDCEDYVVLKYVLIRENNLHSTQDMQPLLVMDGKQAHYVLRVGDKILDNQRKSFGAYTIVRVPK